MEKPDFDEIVRSNINYVKSIVRKYVQNQSIVDELTQEIFLRAYRSYDRYIEQGKLKQWLSIIAENKLKNDYKATKKYYDIYNYCDIDDIFFQNTLTAPEAENPEDVLINNEQTEKIISIINTLPKKQRDIIMYRYVYDYSIKEIEQLMGITSTNVKVTSHTALNSIRQKLGININKKGEKGMKFDKTTAYSYLYQYAKGHISEENKSAVEEYIKTDEEAADIAESLKILHTQLIFANDDEATKYDIIFQLRNGDKVIYDNMGQSVDCANNSNLRIAIGYGYENISMATQRLNTFDSEGNTVRFEQTIKENGTVIEIAKIKNSSYYPIYWTYTVKYIPMSHLFQKSTDSPNLYKMTESYDSFRLDSEYCKAMKYIALPEEAANIRIKRGNGVIECGKYKFAYADRYIMQDESLALDCTFNIN